MKTDPKAVRDLVEAILIDQLHQALTTDYSRLEREIKNLKEEIQRLSQRKS